MHYAVHKSVVEMTVIKVAIIGGGTVGLSVASKLIEERVNNFQDGNAVFFCSIIAEKFYEHTTSFGSGGLWEPYQIAGS